MTNAVAGKSADKGRLSLVLLAVAMAVAAATRFYHLDHVSLWADEVWGILSARNPSLLNMLVDIYQHESHPPGYHFLLHYSMLWFGDSDVAIRMHSALAGVLLVPVVFRFGQKHFSDATAVLAAFLVAGSFNAIYYSQEARANSVMTLFCMLNFLFFVDILMAGSRRRLPEILFALTGIVCCYLHYAALVFVLAEGLVWLLLGLRRPLLPSLGQGFCLFLPILLAYAPWMPGMWYHMSKTGMQMWPVPDGSTLVDTVRFLLGPDMLRYPLLGFLAVAGLLLALASRGEDRRAARILLVIGLVCVIPVAAFYIKSRMSEPAFNQRHFIYLIPLLSLLAAYPVGWLLGRLPSVKASQWLLCLLVALLVPVQVIQNNHPKLRLYNNNSRTQLREAVSLIGNNTYLPRKTAIVASHNFFDHYLRRQGIRGAANFYYLYEKHLPALKKYLATRGYENFYFLEIVVNDSWQKSPLMNSLEQEYTVLCTSHFDWVDVSRFSTTPPAQQPQPQPRPGPCTQDAGKQARDMYIE